MAAGGADAACDAAQQGKATLRVSALAGLMTLALLAAPEREASPAAPAAVRAPTVALPEFVSVKGTDRVPGPAETTSAFRRRPRPAPADEPAATPAATLAPAPAEPPARIEIVDAATLRAGEMVVRIAGIALPARERQCRRLDGLSVSCLDRAESYLALLVRNRAVACDRAGLAPDGTEQGRCRTGEADIAEQMVRQGWAAAAARDEPRLLIAEAQAKRQKLGIWRE
jgi:endonuclease YncB( thermonuclease family)